jgi:hypothetical protein
MKNGFSLLAVFTGACFFFLLSCSKASEDQLRGNNSACDTAGMRYSVNVVPILELNCYGCHGAGNTDGSGGISLDSYAGLKKYADNGYLEGNITHAAGYVGMPYGQPKMDDCDINKIIDWIRQGAPDN